MDGIRIPTRKQQRAHEWCATRRHWRNGEQFPGLFNRVVDDERVVDETLAMAARIAARPPLGITLARQAIRRAHDMNLPGALERERQNQLRLLKTPEARDAMRAFLERRKPPSSQ